jgi:hypothetical protein
VSGELAIALRRRGYVQQRWFPVGAGFVHGFAVATRLEHVEREGDAPGVDRWLPWEPEPANLFWLSGTTHVRLPQPGQYRVFLLAFTDLPLGPTRRAPVWGRDTIMEGPEMPERHGCVPRELDDDHVPQFQVDGQIVPLGSGNVD